ncbi:MAG: hypothetical protein J5I98_33850, partial [Phaeodactylibacter sp.]|nr:hypothetical protein [Phaeodactylibacter sp.]
MERTNSTFIPPSLLGKVPAKLARYWAVLLVIGFFSSYQLGATTCPNATVISSLPFSGAPTCGGNDITSTNAAVCSPVTSSYYGGNEALFTFTPASNMIINVAYSGQTFTQISVYNGCPTSGGTCVAGISSSTSSKNITATVTSGTTYYILIDTWPSPASPCPGTVMVTEFIPPVGDNCGNAQDLATLTSPFSGTTVGYGNDITTGVSCLNASADRIFYIDVPAGANLTIGQLDNSYDSRHRVAYGGACPGDTDIACTDDPDLETVTWDNTTGADQRVYWVQEAFSTATGTFDLAWELTLPPDDPCEVDTWAPVIVYPSQDIVVTLDPCDMNPAVVAFEVSVTDNCDGDHFPAAPGDPVTPGSEYTVTVFSGPGLATVFSAGGDRFVGVFEPGTYQVQISAED